MLLQSIERVWPRAARACRRRARPRRQPHRRCGRSGAGGSYQSRRSQHGRKTTSATVTRTPCPASLISPNSISRATRSVTRASGRWPGLSTSPASISAIPASQTSLPLLQLTRLERLDCSGCRLTDAIPTLWMMPSLHLRGPARLSEASSSRTRHLGGYRVRRAPSVTTRRRE
jgi:hypothetical protein